VQPVAPVVAQCPCCGGQRLPKDTYCGDCGYFYKEPFPEGEASAVPVATLLPPAVPIRLKERYELLEQIGERLGVERFHARDLGLSGMDNIPVIVVREIASDEVATAVPVEATPVGAGDPRTSLLPSFDFPTAGPATDVLPDRPTWPSVAWERNLLDTIEHPGLPVVLDTFFEEGYQYIVEEVHRAVALGRLGRSGCEQSAAFRLPGQGRRDPSDAPSARRDYRGYSAGHRRHH
jgi:hypothetical protein